jgi:hypothetical protein
MRSQNISVAMRLVLSLAAGVALSGCAYYGPPYAAYDGAPVSAPYYNYPYSYGGPVYVGPPVSLSFGYYEHHYRGGYGGHGWHGGPGWRGHGWGGHGLGGRGWGGGGWRGGD